MNINNKNGNNNFPCIVVLKCWMNVDQTMDWKIDFYRRYFVDILDIGWLERILSTDYRMGGISGKLPKYQGYISLDSINRWKKSSVKPVKIWEIYRYFRYISEYVGYISEYIGYIYRGNIGDFFESFFFFLILNLYYHFIFNYFLYLSLLF